MHVSSLPWKYSLFHSLFFPVFLPPSKNQIMKYDWNNVNVPPIKTENFLVYRCIFISKTGKLRNKHVRFTGFHYCFRSFLTKKNSQRTHNWPFVQLKYCYLCLSSLTVLSHAQVLHATHCGKQRVPVAVQDFPKGKCQLLRENASILFDQFSRKLHEN